MSSSVARSVFHTTIAPQRAWTGMTSPGSDVSMNSLYSPSMLRRRGSGSRALDGD